MFSVVTSSKKTGNVNTDSNKSVSQKEQTGYFPDTHQTITIDDKDYEIINTIGDGNCGVDACLKLLQQAGLPSSTNLSKLRKDIVTIVSDYMCFSKISSEANKLNHVRAVFKDLETFAYLAIQEITDKIDNQEKSFCKKDKGEQERLQHLAVKNGLKDILKDIKSWEDLKKIAPENVHLFMTTVDALTHVDEQYISASYYGAEDNGFLIDDYVKKVSESKLWLTNTELICFLRYHGFRFRGYKLIGTAVILTFINHLNREFLLHSNATMKAGSFIEKDGGTHWQALKPISDNSKSRKRKDPESSSESEASSKKRPATSNSSSTIQVDNTKIPAQSLSDELTVLAQCYVTDSIKNNLLPDHQFLKFGFKQYIDLNFLNGLSRSYNNYNEDLIEILKYIICDTLKIRFDDLLVKFQHNPNLRTKLAYCCQHGIGIDKDPKRSFELYQQDAELEHAEAICNLAGYYESGTYMDKDPEAAFKLYQKAAALGNAEAKRHMAGYYLRGVWVEIKSHVRAFYLYKEAAGYGSAESIRHLASCYKNGSGTDKSPKLAFEVCWVAANRGNIFAMYGLGYYYENGIGVAKNPEEAFKWYAKASNFGNTYAMINLWNCYHQGIGVARDDQQAFKWCEKAVELGNTDAMNSLAICYRGGTGVPKDDQTAFNLFEKAAKLGNPSAMNNLGHCYENGICSIAKDDIQAFAWYKKADALGHNEATCNLARYYKNRIEISYEFSERAFELYRKAALRGYPAAMYNLAICYQNGVGVAKDLNKAFEWYQKAADIGHAEAIASLALSKMF